jgi:hypothetical protein
VLCADAESSSDIKDYYPLFRIHLKRFSQRFDEFTTEIRTEKFFLDKKILRQIDENYWNSIFQSSDNLNHYISWYRAKTLTTAPF